MTKRIFIVAGESSGDLHASNLVRALKKRDPELDLRGWGGDLMEKEGVKILKHIRDLSFMGFLEVFLNLRKILNNFKHCKSQILDFKPDLILLVDYPGFNLRMAKWARKNDILVSYYISPQIWAWKASRIHTIKSSVDTMYCILPFEEQYYAEHGVQAKYMGHPLMDEIKSYKEAEAQGQYRKTKPIIAILPGSREQEIERKLSIMLSSTSKFSKFDTVVACAPNMEADFYEKYEKQFPGVRFVYGKTYELLSEADFAIVTSGTATLETALFKVPQVVCYKSSFISYWIARLVIKIKYISLVNLIMDEKIVTELIQSRVNKEEITREVELLIGDDEYRMKMLESYERLIEKIGKEGCSDKIARDLMLKYF